MAFNRSRSVGSSSRSSRIRSHYPQKERGHFYLPEIGQTLLLADDIRIVFGAAVGCA